MNRLLIFALLLVSVVSSCKLTRYDRLPGTKLNTFPKELQGNYILLEHKGARNNTDSSYLKITERAIDLSDSKWKGLMELNDTNALSSYKDLYFYASLVTDNNRKEWFIYPFKVKGDKIFVYTISSGKIQKKLEKYLKLQPDSYNSYVMDDEKFYKFCKKKLKKRHSFALVKTKP